MKVIIAGGRDFQDYGMVIKAVVAFERAHGPVTMVVSGGQRGADLLGEAFAKQFQLPCRRFVADWSRGKVAGPERNARMAEFAEGCIAMPGGKGTRNMVKQARAHGLKMLVWDLAAAAPS